MVKKIFIIKLIVLLILSPVIVFSQETNLSEVIVSIAEELAADDTDPEASSTFIERLYELGENPVNLNSGNEDEISRLFFLSDFQVKALVDYAHSSGRIVTLYEIVNIPGFDKETLEMMRPFITLDNNVIMKSYSYNWRNTLISNLSIRSGNDDTTSLGSPWKILTKYKFSTGSFSGGFTVEKDPGEKFSGSDSPLPDFLSAHLTYNGSGVIRKFILGDFSARFGQGTNINTGIRTGLSLTAPGYISARDEVKPYTSTDENNFFRGMAVECSMKNLDLILLYSKNSLDATLGSSSGTSDDFIENFYKAGVHNTPSQLHKKDVVSETVYGANLSYNFNNIRIGLTWLGNRFSLPIMSAFIKPEDIFDFKGDRNNLYTVYYNSLIKRILLYGEFSTNETFNYAFVQGVSFRPSDRLTINFLYRDYDAGYISFHGRGPGSSSVTGNERGILGNFTFEAAKHLFISAGCDVHSFPWLKYRCSAPSRGKKEEIRIRYLPTEEVVIEASYKKTLSMVDKPETKGIPDQNLIRGKTYKASVRYSLYENVTFTTRIDYKIVEPYNSRGMLMLQDLKYSFSRYPVTLWFRYCLFNTDDWNSRIYTYENDLLYSYSIPALSGTGSRAYLMAGWNITDNAKLRFKYSITTKSEDPRKVNNTEEFRIQIKVTL